jgi:molecular chaperone GrpE
MAKKKKDQDKTKDLTDNLLHDDQASEHPENAPDNGTPDHDPLLKLQDEVSALNDKYLRLYSEFDNYRKRTMRERADLLKNATSGLITQLLPVLDDFERALKSFDTSTDLEALRAGVELIHAKFRKMLEQKGLEEINALGEVFDTDLHEAITNLPAADEAQKGRVVDQVEKGYLLNGTVIRYAKVAVAN